MNQFDFTYVQVYANTKTALKSAGVERSQIRSMPNGCQKYGTRTFRRWLYVATVAYFAADGTGADDVASQWRAKGVGATVKYHAAD